MPTLTTLDHLVLTVHNLEATIEFYQTVLGMHAERFTGTDGSSRMALKFGRQKINLHQATQTFDPKAAVPTPGSADLCFLSATPISDWQRHLQNTQTPIIDGPVNRTGASGPIRSIYIRDPDNNLIEIAESL